jgi:glycerol kinase|tara:strand:+ start:298 stop:1779 length:1482 start_codon:yes stop_codon:yes gene_type:complete
MAQYILSIDQGTTSSRAILFSEQAEPVAVAQREFTQHFPQDGWVEHDPEEIWETTVQVVKEVAEQKRIASSQIAAFGITNQRETTLIWDRATGRPIYNAIVWQDRRTADFCAELQADGFESVVTEKTGLLLDPYFSATKIRWLLDNVDGSRARAEKGELAFGTIDTFLLWRLTGGKVHKTDATNASRTMLFNIYSQQWDEALCRRLDIPLSLLPTVEDSSAEFGTAQDDILGREIPITGIAGDQQAALVGQCCFDAGMTKSTFGTGCFVIANTGSEAVRSENKLLTTVAYRLDGSVTYGLEGSIFVAGAAVQWLRDGLKLVTDAAETEEIARATGSSAGVYLVPAFTGLGAPHWDPNARGAIFGLTRDTGIGEIVTATLQSTCFQTRDLLDAMASDGCVPTLLRVDGGMIANNWLAQFLADMLATSVDRPEVTETTALGACFLAGLKVGVFESLDAIRGLWREERRFDPSMAAAERERLYVGWCTAIDRTKQT